MKECTIAFIGGGNMAQSLIGGLIQDGFTPDNIHVSDPQPLCLEELKNKYGVQVYSDNISAVEQADIVVLAVKPQQLQTVVKQLAPSWQADKYVPIIASQLNSMN